MSKKKRSGFTTVLLILVGVIGLSLLLYPTFSNYLNSIHQGKAISAYVESIENASAEENYINREAAVNYNSNITKRSNTFVLTDTERAEYESCLNMAGDGLIGYIEIPTIELSLPIYHGTSDDVLNSSVGHLDWTSLPVGGEGTHCVLSGHRGLPSAKLFTNLDKLEVGDIFLLYILDEVLTYEVDQILIVDPKDTKDLQIVDGEDYCTLVTCTPYGINTHRLLVRGHRIENIEEVAVVRVTSDAIQIEPLIIAPIIAFPMLIVLFVLILSLESGRKNKYSEMEVDDDEM